MLFAELPDYVLYQSTLVVILRPLKRQINCVRVDGPRKGRGIKKLVSVQETHRKCATHEGGCRSCGSHFRLRRHLCLCGFECGEDALEVHTQWVRNKTSPFSSPSMLL